MSAGTLVYDRFCSATVLKLWKGLAEMFRDVLKF